MDEKLTVEPGTRRKETPPRTWRFWFLAFFLQYLLLWATGTGTLILLWPIYSLRYPSSFDISFVEIVLRNILDPLDFLLFGPARLLLIWIVIAAFLKWFGSGFINFFVPRGLFGSVSNTVDALAGVNQVLIDRRDLAPNEVLFTNRQMVMSQIDNRINSLRNRTGLILISIGLSIIVAATIVIFAGRLTSIDATAVSNLDKLKAELSDANRRQSRLYQFAAIYDQLEPLKKRSDLNSDEARLRTDLARIMHEA